MSLVCSDGDGKIVGENVQFLGGQDVAGCQIHGVNGAGCRFSDIGCAAIDHEGGVGVLPVGGSLPARNLGEGIDDLSFCRVKDMDGAVCGENVRKVPRSRVPRSRSLRSRAPGPGSPATRRNRGPDSANAAASLPRVRRCRA